MAKRKTPDLRLVIGDGAGRDAPNAGELLRRAKMVDPAFPHLLDSLTRRVLAAERHLERMRRELDERGRIIGELVARLEESTQLQRAVHPVLESRVKAYRGRARAAEKSNASRAARRPHGRVLARIVRRLDHDADGRRRSDREILRLLQEEHGVEMTGGNALAKIAKLRRS